MKRRPCNAPWLAWLGAVLLCVVAQAFGAPAQFRQSVWSVERGAPADIWALAQDRDGFLWLGTGSGLYRFDGVAFERFEPRDGERLRANDVTALSMQPDGTLWIGLFHGGASALRDGRLTNYSAREGFPSGMVIAFARDGAGALWAASRGGLARFDGQRWQVVGADWGYPAPHADWAMTDRDGTLWISTGEELLFLRRGARRFEASGVRVERDTTLTQAPDGVLWLSSGPRGTSALPGISAAHPFASGGASAGGDATLVHSKRLLFDREGHLWGTEAMRGGVYRIDAPSRLADGRPLPGTAFDALYDRSHGLPSSVAVPLLEDREGTVWTGTNLGLVSYHANRVQVPAEISVGPGINLGLAVDADGAVWLANGGVLQRRAADGVRIEASGLPDVNALLYADGTLWLMGGSYLGRLEHGRLLRIEVPVSASRWSLEALAGDGHGGLWGSFLDHGLFHWRDGVWTPVEQGTERGTDAPMALAVDRAGRLWAGYPDGHALCLDGARRRIYGAGEGLHVGGITTFAVHGDQLLVGGDQGVARWRDGHFEPLAGMAPSMLVGVSGIALTAQGDAWINGSRGVLHIEAAELARGFDGQPAAYELLDYHDGLPGIALQASPVSTAALDGAGRVWFNTNQGAAWIDPAQIRRNPAAPATFVQALLAGEQRYPAGASLQLPQQTSSIRLQYTATSLAMPDRVRFRYRLDGVDEGWQDAGTRREASYAHLGPGHYRFRVTAANEDGVWNEQGASLDFSIAPQFFQTGWFRALCLAAGVLLAAGLYLWRLRRMAERIHLRLEERMRERERIARELHDTLLQGVQGLLLRLQALAAGLGDAPAKAALDAAIRRARDMLVEGRDRIVALRGEAGEGERLLQALRAVGEDMQAGQDVAYQVAVEGEEKPLCAPAADEVIDIAREAIRNAFQHAQARRIEVRVTYQAQALRLHVQDDGIGIPVEVLRRGRLAGHWGLLGMHERAQRLGASLTIRRGERQGTDVALSVPGHVVFDPAWQARK